MAIIKGGHGKPSAPQQAVEIPAAANGGQVGLEVPVPTKSFKYLTIDPAAPAADAFLPQGNPTKIKELLVKLANAMVDEAIADGRDSTIPAVYTYWGQFIDHDITAGTNAPNGTVFNLLDTDILKPDFTPQPPQTVVDSLTNKREPKLDLDSVYGAEAGPEDEETQKEGIYHLDKVHLRVGHNTVNEVDPNSPFHTSRTPPSALGEKLSRRRDLPRHADREPRVGDGRNDENTIVSQFHTAFLFFHNAVVEWLDEHPEVLQDPIFDKKDLFSVARQIVRWTHQYLVVHDYLPSIAKDEIVEELAKPTTPSFFEPDKQFMPLEFSAAAFRFGHSMVRDNYDFNMNFGHPDGLPAGVAEFGKAASLGLLFTFTGKGGFLGSPATPINSLPVNWIIQWDRFTEIPANPEEIAGVPSRGAQKIDTNLANQLNNMIREDGKPFSLNKHLAQRNLLRGYLLSIPTGQHVAQQMGVPVLTTELLPEDKPKVKEVLQDQEGELLHRTPLWYYILREAELEQDPKTHSVGAGGNSLGSVGSYVVAGTLIGLIKADPISYINKQWHPEHATAVRLPDGSPIDSIAAFFQFAGVAPFVKKVEAPVAVAV